MLKELKEIIDNELKETRIILSHYIEIINNEIEIIRRRNQTEMLELRSIIITIKKFTRNF